MILKKSFLRLLDHVMLEVVLTSVVKVLELEFFCLYFSY